MRTSRFTDSQILVILSEYKSGQAAKELSWKYGFHYQTLQDWKKKFSGINSTKEMAKIKELESKNNRLKKMFANLSLEY